MKRMEDKKGKHEEEKKELNVQGDMQIINEQG